jgi:arginine exporter protein ArgO
VLSYLAVLAGLRLGGPRPWTLTLFVVLGIFVGSMLWWIVLSLIAGHFRRRFNDHAVVVMNRIGAVAIGAFGVLTMAMSAK